MIRPIPALLASAALAATAPAAAAVNLAQEAGGYRVELSITPAKAFVAAKRGGAGVVRVAGADPVALDAPSRPTHHLAVSVADAKTGKPVTDADIGLHTICAVMTAEFLEHQGSIGNDLTTPRPEFRFPGLIPGDR